MDTGMLWFDDSPGALNERVRRAVEYYAQKFGRSPTLCLVNPAMLEREGAVDGIQLRGARTVMPNHFFLGEERNGRRNGDGGAGGGAKPNGRAGGGLKSNGGSAKSSGTRRAKAAKSGGRPSGKQAKDGSA